MMKALTDILRQLAHMLPQSLCSLGLGLLLTFNDYQSQSYVTTDGLSANLSWCQTPIWGPRPDFCYCDTLRVCLCGAPTLGERMVLSFTTAAALASAVILGSQTRGTHAHILLPQIRDSPTWKARTPCLHPLETGWPNYAPRGWVRFRRPL
jgi:hypothetical protein